MIYANSNSSRSALTKIVSQLQNQGFFVDDDYILVVLENLPDAVVEPSSTNESQIVNNGVMKKWKFDGRHMFLTSFRGSWLQAIIAKVLYRWNEVQKVTILWVNVSKTIFHYCYVSWNDQKSSSRREKNHLWWVPQVSSGLQLLMATVQGPLYWEYWSEQTNNNVQIGAF